MASSIFPVPVTSSLNAYSITAASPNVLYEGTINLETAIYTLTCVNTTIAKFIFLSDNTTVITTSETISGTVTINLGTAATKVRIWTDTGSDVVVTLNKIASALTNSFSGTLDTVTTTSTYTGTSASGYGYAVLVGGGGGGGGQIWNTGNGGTGATGGVCSKVVALTGSMSAVIGAAGTGGTYQVDGGDGGTSTFAGMSAGGGGGGVRGTNSTNGTGGIIATATGGTYNQATVGRRDSRNAPDTPQIWSFVPGGTLGTGGIGNDNSGATAGKVDPTGYGAGGAGGRNYNSYYGQTTTGQTGGPGGLLVLRF